MKLFGSLTSPFVRTVRIAALELGLGDEIELVATVVKPTAPNRDYGDAVNPLRRVPSLQTRDGEHLVDSRVIVDYLNVIGNGTLLGSDDAARIDCLNRHAAMAGATEALVSAMYETRLRPEDMRWAAWSDDQIDKASAAFTWAEARIDRFAAEFDLGAIALVCLAGYAHFRFPDRDWFKFTPSLGALVDDLGNRQSVIETTPRD